MIITYSSICCYCPCNLTAFTTLTIAAFGQTSNSTLPEEQILNKTESQQPSEDQNQGLDKEIIKVSSTEFNELLNEIKDSINLIQQKKYDDATSRLGLAIIEILNSTHQYQELVQLPLLNILTR